MLSSRYSNKNTYRSRKSSYSRSPKGDVIDKMASENEKMLNDLLNVSSAEVGIEDFKLDEIYTWIDNVSLTRPKKNIARDFSDCVLMA